MKALGVILIVLILLPGMLLFSAWLIMVVWGGLAHAFDFRTIGFGTAILISIALSVVGSFFRGSKE